MESWPFGTVLSFHLLLNWDNRSLCYDHHLWKERKNNKKFTLGKLIITYTLNEQWREEKIRIYVLVSLISSNLSTYSKKAEDIKAESSASVNPPHWQRKRSLLVQWILDTETDMEKSRRRKHIDRVTMNGFLHKRLPKSLPINLNKIFFLNEIIQVLIWLFSIYKCIPRNRNSIWFKTLEVSPDEQIEIEKKTSISKQNWWILSTNVENKTLS